MISLSVDEGLLMQIHKPMLDRSILLKHFKHGDDNQACNDSNMEFLILVDDNAAKICT